MHSCHQDGIHVPAVQRVLLCGGTVSVRVHRSSRDFNTSHAQKLQLLHFNDFINPPLTD